MRIFALNLSRLVHSLLPPALRHYSIRELVLALLAPAQQLQDTFEELQVLHNMQAQYTNQVGALHWAVNDRFRPGHNGIFDATNEAIYFEEQPMLADTFLFYENTTIYASSESFVEIEATTSQPKWIKSEQFTTTFEPRVKVYFKEPPTSPELIALQDALDAFLYKFMPVGISYRLTSY